MGGSNGPWRGHFGACVLGPVAKRLGALMQSAARYPNIKPGQGFIGYA